MRESVRDPRGGLGEMGVEVGILNAGGIAETLAYFNGYLYVSGPDGIRRIDPKSKRS